MGFVTQTNAAARFTNGAEGVSYMYETCKMQRRNSLTKDARHDRSKIQKPQRTKYGGYMQTRIHTHTSLSMQTIRN